MRRRCISRPRRIRRQCAATAAARRGRCAGDRRRFDCAERSGTGHDRSHRHSRKPEEVAREKARCGCDHRSDHRRGHRQIPRHQRRRSIGAGAGRDHRSRTRRHAAREHRRYRSVAQPEPSSTAIRSRRRSGSTAIRRTAVSTSRCSRRKCSARWKSTRSPEARLPEGSLGGTIIMHSVQPLDVASGVFSGSIGYNYNDMVDKGKPDATLFYSWHNDDKTFGIDVSAQHYEQVTDRQGLEVFGYNPVSDYAAKSPSVAAQVAAGTLKRDGSGARRNQHRQLPADRKAQQLLRQRAVEADGSARCRSRPDVHARQPRQLQPVDLSVLALDRFDTRRRDAAQLGRRRSGHQRP